MDRDTLDRLWQQALMESVRDGEQYTRYHFAALIEQHLTSAVHSCHPNCDKPACVAIRAAVAAEREECARVCDTHWDDNGQHCANAIRSRT